MSFDLTELQIISAALIHFRDNPPPKELKRLREIRAAVSPQWIDRLCEKVGEDHQTLATIEIAVIDLLGAIERDNTGDNSSPDDEMWIGHCGVEIRALCRVLDLDPGV